MSKNALPIGVMYRRISDVHFPSRASVKREPRSCPTKNHVANLTPLRFRRYFNNDDSACSKTPVTKQTTLIVLLPEASGLVCGFAVSKPITPRGKHLSYESTTLIKPSRFFPRQPPNQNPGRVSLLNLTWCHPDRLGLLRLCIAFRLRSAASDLPTRPLF